MRGKTVINIIVVIIAFVFGWTCGQIFDNVAVFRLDRTISLSDIVSILVDIGIAIVIALLVEKSMQNQRVEKDFFISELDDAQREFADLSKVCSHLDPLSLKQTVYQVEKPKKNLMKMWETMRCRNKSFHDRKKNDFYALMTQIKILNSQLSDSKYFKTEEGYQPVIIKNNKIYLNNTVVKTIDETFDNIKDCIFKMKIDINEM